jgi:hypothetical protein
MAAPLVPRGFFSGSVGAATTYNLASLAAAALTQSGLTPTALPADHAVLRIETASARWIESQASAPNASYGIPLLAGDGVVRLSTGAQIAMLAAGVLNAQFLYGGPSDVL